MDAKCKCTRLPTRVVIIKVLFFSQQRANLPESMSDSRSRQGTRIGLPKGGIVGQDRHFTHKHQHTIIASGKQHMTG